MFNGKAENIQLTRQLSPAVALKMAAGRKVCISEETKIFLFFPSNYVIFESP